MPLYFKNNAHLNFETPKNLVSEFCVDKYPKQNLLQKVREVVINVKLFSNQSPKKRMINSGIVIGKFYQAVISRVFPFGNNLFLVSKDFLLWIYPGADILPPIYGLSRFKSGQLSLQPYLASESL